MRQIQVSRGEGVLPLSRVISATSSRRRDPRAVSPVNSTKGLHGSQISLALVPLVAGTQATLKECLQQSEHRNSKPLVEEKICAVQVFPLSTCPIDWARCLHTQVSFDPQRLKRQGSFHSSSKLHGPSSGIPHSRAKAPKIRSLSSLT